MENEQQLKFYGVFPGKEQVEKDFEDFLEANPQFRGKIKAGKTFLEGIVDPGVSPRYISTDKYEELTLANVFVRCATQDIALQVERTCQDYMKSKGMMINNSDCGKGVLGTDPTKTPVVYVTKYKKDLFKCPLQSCPVVMTLTGIESHKMKHDSIVDTIRVNKLLKTLRKDKLDDTDPIPWIPEDHEDKKKCQYCGRTFHPTYDMFHHEKYYCTENPNRREKTSHVCPICKKTVYGSLNRHMWTHNKDDGKFTCPICGKVMSKPSKARHMKLHDPSQYELCPTCGKSIAKPSMKDHMKTHKPRPTFKCGLCGRWISVEGRLSHMRNMHQQGPSKS